MIISAYRSFFLFLAGFLGEGWAIVALSCICSALMAPLMKAVAGVVRREAAYQEVIIPQIARIKETFPGDMERNLHIQRLYRRYGYSPLSAVKKVLPLFVQIPFLLLTYYMLKGTAELNGVQFLFLKDLGKPDALLSGINLLPFVMTGVNLLTVAATPGFTKRDQTQAVGISLLFLVLLYTAPSALLLYWTLNNVITMVRTFMGKRCSGVRLLLARLAVLPHAALMFVRPDALREVSRSGFMLKVICNFVALNLVVVLGLILFFSRSVPVEVKLDTRASGSITVLLGDANLHAQAGYVFTKSLRPPTMNEPDGLYREYFSKEDLTVVPAFKITATAAGDVSVVSLTESFFGLLEKRMAGEAFASAFRTIPDGVLKVGPDGQAILTVGSAGVELIPNANADTRWSYVILASHRVKIAILVFEAALLMLSLFCAAYFLSIPGARNGALECLLVAGLLAGYLTYALPFQTYLANRNDFIFSAPELAIGAAVPCLVVGAMLFVVCYLSKFGMGMLLPLLLTAGLTYEFIQTGILSIGAPRLNGDTAYYHDSFRSAIDLLFLFGIMVCVCLCYRCLKHRVVALVKVLGVVIGISVVVVAFSNFSSNCQKPVSGLDPAGYCSRMTVANAVKWSSHRNVLVFVLDSCTTEVAHDVLGRSPDIAEMFNGFVAFENNVGMHHESNFATVGLMTGEYYDAPYDEGLVDEYLHKTFETNSLLSIYRQAGANVYFLPTVYPSGYAYPVEPTESSLKTEESPFYVRPEGGMSFTLYELLRFRLMPFCMKAPMFAFTFAAMPGHGRVDLESQLYPILEKSPVVDCDMTFAFFHTEGAHIPYDITEDGRSVHPPETGYAAYLRKATFVFRRLGKVFDTLREKGVYDNSLILVVADHGPHVKTDTVKYNSDDEYMPINGRPMLLAKPVSATDAFVFDESTPTCHAKIYDLLRLSCCSSLPKDELKDVLLSERRLYVRPVAPFLRRIVDRHCRRLE